MLQNWTLKEQGPDYVVWERTDPLVNHVVPTTGYDDAILDGTGVPTNLRGYMYTDAGGAGTFPAAGSTGWWKVNGNGVLGFIKAPLPPLLAVVGEGTFTIRLVRRKVRPSGRG